MFRSYWGIAIALGLAFLVTGSLAQQDSKPALEGDPVTQGGQKQGAPQSRGATAGDQEKASSFLTAIEGIERAIREAIAADNKEQDERQEQREIRDLSAQESMARWTKYMFWTAAGTVALTFGGLLLIWKTLVQTRRAADYASDMLDEAKATTDAARETVELGMANISVTQIDAVINCRTGGNHNFVLGMNFRNTGDSTAIDIRFWAKVRLVEGEKEIFSKDYVPTEFNRGGFEVPPREKENVCHVLRDTVSWTNEFVKLFSEGNIVVVVDITIKYRTILGNRPTVHYEYRGSKPSSGPSADKIEQMTIHLDRASMKTEAKSPATYRSG